MGSRIGKKTKESVVLKYTTELRSAERKPLVFIRIVLCFFSTLFLCLFCSFPGTIGGVEKSHLDCVRN